MLTRKSKPQVNPSLNARLQADVTEYRKNRGDDSTSILMNGFVTSISEPKLVTELPKVFVEYHNSISDESMETVN